MSPRAENDWLIEKRTLTQFHLEDEHSGFGVVRRRQALPEEAEQSLNRSSTPPLHSSTPMAGTGREWRKNFEVDKSHNSSSTSSPSTSGDWSLGGDSGYGGLSSSRIGAKLPFPEKSSTWWSSLLRRLSGRPSLLEPEMAARWVRLPPQQMVALVLSAALLSCIGFSSFLLFKHMPRGQNLVQSRELLNQETNGKLFGEDYDDPFQGMEPIFGLETSGTEDESPENNEAEEIEKAQEIPIEDYEEKRKELLNKIKSFGLATAPLDNLSGSKKEQSLKGSEEEEVRVESSETPASPEVPESDKDAATAATKDLKPSEQINEGNGKGQAGGEGVKRKAKKTKAVNPLVKRQKTKISKAKKLQ